MTPLPRPGRAAETPPVKFGPPHAAAPGLEKTRDGFRLGFDLASTCPGSLTSAKGDFAFPPIQEDFFDETGTTERVYELPTQAPSR